MKFESPSPKFVGNQEFLNDQLFATEVGIRLKISRDAMVTEAADPLAANGGRTTSAVLGGDLVPSGNLEEFNLNQVLEQARLATGATGAAIALVQGKQIVCRATSGPDAPDLGTCLDPRFGLSGSCIQTHQLQQCNDTETDPRVDADACRNLGVRSVVVLPLMLDGELFGIVEILWSRPNAFGQSDVYNLQALTDRILGSQKQRVRTIATALRKGSGSLQRSEDFGLLNKLSESSSEIPRRERVSRKNGIWTPILGVIVIVAAILLGIDRLATWLASGR